MSIILNRHYSDMRVGNFIQATICTDIIGFLKHKDLFPKANIFLIDLCKTI